MEEIKKDWRDIFRAFRMAFDPKKVILAFSGVVTTVISFAILTAIFGRIGLIKLDPKVIINDTFFSSKLCPYSQLLAFCKSMMTQFSVGQLISSVVMLFTFLIIWSIIGGAITRIAAVEYAKDEGVRMVDALKFSTKKFWSYFCSPIVPALGVILFTLCNVLCGFIGKFGVFGDIFLAVSFPLTLLFSFLTAFVGVIGVIGLCLMFPTISAEGSDAFDAMSRAYSYVLSKPRKYLTYFITSTVYGIFCIAFVAFLACFVVNITFDTVSIGMGAKFREIISAVGINPGYCSIVGVSAPDFCAGFSTLTNWAEKLMALSVLLSLVTVKILVVGFALAYLGSAKTIVYLLMRKDVDETDISDVYIEENEFDTMDEDDTSTIEETPVDENSDNNDSSAGDDVKE